MIYTNKDFIVKDNLKITLKSPCIDDAQELVDYFSKVCTQTNLILTSHEDIPSVSEQAKLIENIRQGNDYCICAFLDNKIIGLCNINFNTHLKNKHRCTFGIVVDKDYWRRGIGNILMDEMINIVKSKSEIKQIELETYSINSRAISLYESKGFVKMGTIPNGYLHKDGTSYDEVLMIKTL